MVSTLYKIESKVYQQSKNEVVKVTTCGTAGLKCLSAAFNVTALLG